MIESAKNLMRTVTSSVPLRPRDSDSVMRSIINGMGLYEHSIGEFFHNCARVERFWLKYGLYVTAVAVGPRLPTG